MFHMKHLCGLFHKGVSFYVCDNLLTFDSTNVNSINHKRLKKVKKVVDIYNTILYNYI